MLIRDRSTNDSPWWQTLMSKLGQNTDSQPKSEKVLKDPSKVCEEVMQTLAVLAKSSEPEKTPEYKTLEALEESVDQALAEFDDVTRLSDTEQHYMHMLLGARSDIASFFIGDEVLYMDEKPAAEKPEKQIFVVTGEARQAIFHIVTHSRNLQELQERVANAKNTQIAVLNSILVGVATQLMYANKKISRFYEDGSAAQVTPPEIMDDVADFLDKIQDYALKRRIKRLVMAEVDRIAASYRV